MAIVPLPDVVTSRYWGQNAEFYDLPCSKNLERGFCTYVEGRVLELLRKFDMRSHESCWVPKLRHTHHLIACGICGSSASTHRASMCIKLDRHNSELGFILHRCGIEGCINPSHLYEGTSQDNSDDSLLHKKLGKGAYVVHHMPR